MYAYYNVVKCLSFTPDSLLHVISVYMKITMKIKKKTLYLIP